MAEDEFKDIINEFKEDLATYDKFKEKQALDLIQRVAKWKDKYQAKYSNETNPSKKIYLKGVLDGMKVIDALEAVYQSK